MISRIAAMSAWSLLVAIAFVTLSPIDLRPHTGHDIAERALAFSALGAAFGVGYPRRPGFAIAITCAAAVGLEMAQVLAPGRHARLFDAGEKLVGGLVGVAIAILWLALFARRRGAGLRA
jgi:VanZ family protein